MEGTPQAKAICILGAGPAGLSAALVLAKKGLEVTLIDKDKFPRDKICGDGLSGSCLSALKKMDEGILRRLHESKEAHPSWGAQFSSPNLKSVKIIFDEAYQGDPPGYVMRRADLDNFLMQEVKKHSGVRVIEGVHVKEIHRSGNGYTLLDPGTGFRFECTLLLLATGFNPGLIQSLSPDFPLKDKLGLGIRGYFEGVHGFDKDSLIEIHFLKELLPCYLWIFPLGGGKANVGLALPSETVLTKKIVLKELLFRLIEDYPHLKKRFRDSIPPEKIEAQRLPFFRGKVPVSGDHFMLLGDAARLIDPFSGEGISNAMHSGIIAAGTAAMSVEKNDFSAAFLKEYDALLYEKLEKGLMLGMKLQDLARNAMLLNLVIGKASRSKKMKGLLRDVLFGMNSMKNLGKPLFYAKMVLGID